MTRNRNTNVARDSDNQRASKITRAATSRCPKCGRKAALRTDPTIVYCYWATQGKCDYYRDRE